MDDLDFLDEELEMPSVFIDESKLSSEYIPKNLLFRNENLKSIVRHFRSIFTDVKITRKMIITGSVGTGKTSLAKKFGLWVNKKDAEGMLNIKYVHINCRRNRTPFMIFLSIARELNSHIPSRGYSADELMEMIVELLEVKKMTLLLVLDEIDFVPIQESSNLLYTLSRTTDDREDPKHRIALILIAQKTNFLNHLDRSTKSSLSAATMELKTYTKHQLVKIIEERIKESFVHGSVSKESIDLAGEIAALRGDARRALELMWYAGKHADKENSSLVYPDHVRLAKANIEPSILRQVIKVLPKHKLMLLIGIARQLLYTHAAYITTGNAEITYHIVCEEYEIMPRKHTQIWEYLKEFENIGILSMKKSGIGQRGKTKHISIQDVSALELEKEVLKRLQELLPKSMLAK